MAGHTASLRILRLDKILTFAGEVGLVVVLHNDINHRASRSRAACALRDDLKTVFRAHKRHSIIWAHTGLGRFVKPTPIIRSCFASCSAATRFRT